ncbi:MAG: hypothetical protein DRI69_05905 [Bacteroidetes bacterium]|nr:MAG: hypothetical protein DRI69_05905 [Bacteroidota bacterium]
MSSSDTISVLGKICLIPYSNSGSSISVGSIEWKELVRAAHAHSVIPMLYDGLKGLSAQHEVPYEFMEYLKVESKKIFVKNLRVRSELIALSELLSNNDIDHVFYKGVVVVEMFYQRSGLREFNDNDILIKYDDLPRIRALFQDRGYEPITPLNEIGEKKILKFEKELSLVKRKDGKILHEADVHWMLLRPSFGMPIAYDELRPDMIEMKVGSTDVNTVTAECSFVILCIHHGVNEGWSKIKYLLDIHMAVEHISASGGWKDVKACAERLGVLRVVHASLLIAKRYLDTAIPEEIMSEALSDRSAQEICDAHTFVKDESHWGELKRKITLRNRGSKLGLVFHHLLELASPNYADQEFVRLPNPGKMFWLYYLIKPIRILSKGENRNKFN